MDSRKLRCLREDVFKRSRKQQGQYSMPIMHKRIQPKDGSPSYVNDFVGKHITWHLSPEGEQYLLEVGCSFERSFSRHHLEFVRCKGWAYQTGEGHSITDLRQDS